MELRGFDTYFGYSIGRYEFFFISNGAGDSRSILFFIHLLEFLFVALASFFPLKNSILLSYSVVIP